MLYRIWWTDIYQKSRCMFLSFWQLYMWTTGRTVSIRKKYNLTGIPQLSATAVFYDKNFFVLFSVTVQYAVINYWKVL